MSATRQHVHELVDELPAESLDDAARALEQIRTRARPSLREFFDQAPYDDEELSPQEREAIAEGKRAAQEGRFVSDARLVEDLHLIGGTVRVLRVLPRRSAYR